MGSVSIYKEKLDSYKYPTTPFCKGVHWPYASAIAKTLEELDDEIIVGLMKKGLCPDDPDIVFRVTIKDGADGMGSVSIYKENLTPIYPTTPFCKGVHWPYASAIAKTLEERDYEIIVGLTKKGLCPDDPSIIFRVTFKDGADGMGSVSIYKEKLDSYLPDNAFL